ncbi:MAG: hypothetical protein JWO06_555, partial [Bacteroidota bacterium]|nr:hypothetical protein [Bacteroidota bacterium]
QKECVLPDPDFHTRFPKDQIADYAPRGYYVRSGLSDKADMGRLVIKGSPDFNYANIVASTTTSSVTLKEPFYTGSFDIPPGKVYVYFSKTSNPSGQVYMDSAWLTSSAAVSKNLDNFSIVFYGCTDPFAMLNGGPSITSDQYNVKSREYFKRILNNEQIPYYRYHRDDNGKKRKYLFDAAEPTKLNSELRVYKEPLLLPAKLIIGDGDQVYAEAGYKLSPDCANSSENLLSAWMVEPQPRARLTVPNFREHMNNLYLYSNQFKSFNDVFSKFPTIAMWDDHEIRDGWGSEGDEYDKNNSGVLAPKYADYYRLARKAFIQHQLALSPVPLNKLTELENNNEEFHQEVTVGGKKCFIFDLRSNRNKCDSQVITPAQMNRFLEWCKSIQQNEEIIIVSTIPISASEAGFFEKEGKKLMPELVDDLDDSWSSAYNIGQRNQILKVILEMRIKKNVKTYIVSGDIHQGCIIELWYVPYNGKPKYNWQDRKVLAYELIASGLTHETIVKNHAAGFSDYFLEKSQRPRWNEDFVPVVVDGQKYMIKVLNHFTKPNLNFGALEFKNGATSLNLFMVEQDWRPQFKDTPTYQQHIFKCEWDKPSKDEEKWEIKNFGTRLKHFFNPGGRNYRPSLPHETRIIHM